MRPANLQDPALAKEVTHTPGSLFKSGVGVTINNKKSEMFIHHVFFWLKNPSSETDRSQFLEGLRSLTDIETIKTAHIGVPANTDRPVIDKSYAYSLLLSFDDKEKHDIYQDHSIHHKFVQGCSSLWEKVLVYDSVDAS